MGSRTMESVRTTPVVTTHRMEQSQFMDGALCCFLFDDLIQTAVQRLAVTTSLVSMRSVCAVVTFRDTRRASRASFPRPYHNQRVV